MWVNHVLACVVSFKYVSHRLGVADIERVVDAVVHNSVSFDPHAFHHPIRNHTRVPPRAFSEASRGKIYTHHRE